MEKLKIIIMSVFAIMASNFLSLGDAFADMSEVLGSNIMAPILPTHPKEEDHLDATVVQALLFLLVGTWGRRRNTSGLPNVRSLRSGSYRASAATSISGRGCSWSLSADVTGSRFGIARKWAIGGGFPSLPWPVCDTAPLPGGIYGTMVTSQCCLSVRNRFWRPRVSSGPISFLCWMKVTPWRCNRKG